ncbi:MAG: DUF885 domain-containing protein [Pseudomonadota bacterium]
MTIVKSHAAWLAIGAAMLAGCGGEDAGTPPPAAPLEAPQATATEETRENPSDAFLAMAERHAGAYLEAYPEMATQLGVSADLAGENHLSRLGGYGFEAHEKFRQLNETFIQELRAHDRDALSGTAAATYDVLKNAYEIAARRNAFVFGGASPAGGSAPQVGATWAVTPYLVTQLTGPHLYLPRMLQTQHPLETAAQAEAYLARLDDFDRVFDEVIETLNSDAQTGVTPPAFSVEGSINGVRGFIATPPADHPLVATFAEKITGIGALDDEARAALTAVATEKVETVVYPAYVRLAAALEALAPQASADAGVWRFGEEGEAFYQMALDAYGGGGRSGAEIHEIGLSEVARITDEMDAILESIDLADGTVSERLTVLGDRDGAIYPNTDEGREALLESLREQVRDVMAVSPDWFGALPEQAIEVRRIPVYEQDSSPGGYYSGPSLDGTRPGIYWINLKNTADSPKMGLRTLTHHEAVPGHHFQISLQRAIPDMPVIRNMLSYSEFAEGWALYGEALAKEMGMYEGDPLGDLGRLQAELFRAARLVVDTGLHYKRWSREQAIDYMVEATGESRASVTREVERYAASALARTSCSRSMPSL